MVKIFGIYFVRNGEKKDVTHTQTKILWKLKYFTLMQTNKKRKWCWTSLRVTRRGRGRERQRRRPKTSTMRKLILGRVFYKVWVCFKIDDLLTSMNFHLKLNTPKHHPFIQSKSNQQRVNIQTILIYTHQLHH